MHFNSSSSAYSLINTGQTSIGSRFIFPSCTSTNLSIWASANKLRKLHNITVCKTPPANTMTIIVFSKVYRLFDFLYLNVWSNILMKYLLNLRRIEVKICHGFWTSSWKNISLSITQIRKSSAAPAVRCYGKVFYNVLWCS